MYGFDGGGRSISRWANLQCLSVMKLFSAANHDFGTLFAGVNLGSTLAPQPVESEALPELGRDLDRLVLMMYILASAAAGVRGPISCLAIFDKSEAVLSNERPGHKDR